MVNKNNKKSKIKNPACFFILLLVLVAIILQIRSCGKAYSKCAYCVVVVDDKIFNVKPLPLYVKERGRILIEECLIKDKDIDGGDGHDKGKVRWYVCSGIDCDEGWRDYF